MPGKTKVPEKLDERLVMALGHSIRLDCLRILSERPASPNQLATELNIALSNVSHHVTVLKDLGFIELIHTQPVRGTIEHIYRATARAFIDDESWAKLPPKAREDIPALIGASIFGGFLGALRAGTISAGDESHLSWRLFPTDEQGWADVVALLAETYGSVEDIRAASDERLTATGEDGAMTMVSLMGFETPPQ